jgi:hypothetical protein
MRDFADRLAECLGGEGRPGAGPVVAAAPAAAAGARKRRRWSWHKALWILLIGVAVAGLAAGVVLWRSRSGEAAPGDGGAPAARTGAIQIDLQGSRAPAEVRIDDEPIDAAALARPLSLPAGVHRLLVRGDGLETVNESFTVARGENPVLRLTLLAKPDEPAADRGERKRRPREHDDDDHRRKPHRSDDDDPDDDP